MVKIVFYGRLADLMGREREAPLDGASATVGALMRRMAADEAAFASALAGMRVQYAVNDTIVTPETSVMAGDEIAVLPPFSGG